MATCTYQAHNIRAGELIGTQCNSAETVVRPQLGEVGAPDNQEFKPTTFKDAMEHRQCAPLWRMNNMDDNCQGFHTTAYALLTPFDAI